MKYKVCVVGDHGDLLPYRMAGIDCFEPGDTDELDRLIDRLSARNYGIIYLMENWALRVPETVERFERELTPAIIPLPGRFGGTGYGEGRLHRLVEQAIGTNILKTQDSE